MLDVLCTKNMMPMNFFSAPINTVDVGGNGDALYIFTYTYANKKYCNIGK